MNKKTSIIAVTILLLSMVISGCNQTGKIEGVIVQEASDIDMSGTIKLMPVSLTD